MIEPESVEQLFERHRRVFEVGRLLAEALRRQNEFFGGRDSIEGHWFRYNARFKALSNWTKYVARRHRRRLANASAMRGGAFGRAYIRSM